MRKKNLLLTFFTAAILTIFTNTTVFAFPMNNDWSTNQWVGPNYQQNGNIVRCVQILVKAAGYDPGPIDGLYGNQTYNAISNYQASHGLQSDGIVGTGTWNELHTHLWINGDSTFYNPYSGSLSRVRNYGCFNRNAGFRNYLDMGNWDVMDQYGNLYPLY